jgi:hypothetical protein
LFRSGQLDRRGDDLGGVAGVRARLQARHDRDRTFLGATEHGSRSVGLRASPSVGAASDYLVAASSTAGDAVVIEDEHGAARDWGEGLELEPGEPLSLASFGDHLQVTGLKHPVEEGESFPLTLTFKTAGTITVKVIVEKTPGD